MSTKHKIYCFNNNTTVTDWNNIVAVADDGHCLAGHICSAPCFFKHDIGIESNWKHELYNAHFGEGNWELIWIDDPTPGKNPELDAAMVLNQKLAEAEAKSEPEKWVPIEESE